MVSLRFPFSSFSKPNAIPHANTYRSFSFAAVTCAVTAGATAFAASHLHTDHPTTRQFQFLRHALNLLFPDHSSSPLWASLSLADSSTSPPVVDSKTGAAFPSVISDSRKLLGIGLRKKCILGLKNIDVYAFGVYADDDEAKEILGEKYGKLSSPQLKNNKEFEEDLIEGDFGMTVRLQIVYSKLSIRSVRSAFEESVGSRLQKFDGTDNKELLQRFTSQFKDEYKIPRGSVIDLSRERGYVLRTSIDGKEVGSIQSKVLCKSIFDLYIGEDPFDRKAKEDIESKLATFLQK